MAVADLGGMFQDRLLRRILVTEVNDQAKLTQRHIKVRQKIDHEHLVLKVCPLV